MKVEVMTLLKEDVLALGRLVNLSVAEVIGLLLQDSQSSLDLVEEQEESINKLCLEIEEKCLDLLMDRQALSDQEIRSLFGAAIIASKFERMADHAYRVGRLATWAAEDKIDIPLELPEMAKSVHRMVDDVLVCYLTDAADKVAELIQCDKQIDYLHDSLSKQLLSSLGNQEHAHAQMRAQFLFCARFLERMGDAATSVAKRVYFIGTGKRFQSQA